MKEIKRTPRIDYETRSLLYDPSTLKMIVTKDIKGRPAVDILDKLRVTTDKDFEYLEYERESRVQRNLELAHCFHTKVTLVLRHPDGRSVEIEGYPRKLHVSGSHMECHIDDGRSEDAAHRLIGAWRIIPEHISKHSAATFPGGFGQVQVRNPEPQYAVAL